MRSFLFSLHFFLLSFSLILTESEAQSIALLPRALLCQEKLLRRIQIREKGICIKDFIPSGNKNPVGIGQQQPVDLPPPMTNASSFCSPSRANSSGRSAATSAPGAQKPPRESTILRRPGSAPGRDSKVFLPITTAWPRVVSRKNFISSLTRTSRPPSFPIPQF